jgi:hypothetical protein
VLVLLKDKKLKLNMKLKKVVVVEQVVDVIK